MWVGGICAEWKQKGFARPIKSPPSDGNNTSRHRERCLMMFEQWQNLNSTGGKEAKQKEKAKDLFQIFIRTETVTSCASWLVKVI